MSGRCIPKQALVAIHGGWSSWGVFTECSRRCGGGVTKKYRSCTKPRFSINNIYIYMCNIICELYATFTAFSLLPITEIYSLVFISKYSSLPEPLYTLKKYTNKQIYIPHCIPHCIPHYSHHCTSQSINYNILASETKLNDRLLCLRT